MRYKDVMQRCVSVVSLELLCQCLSAGRHQYAVQKVSRSRVHVSYSNPNSFGVYNPLVAVFPCYPFLDAQGQSDRVNPVVVLDPLRVIGPEDLDAGAAWRCFEPLLTLVARKLALAA